MTAASVIVRSHASGPSPDACDYSRLSAFTHLRPPGSGVLKTLNLLCEAVAHRYTDFDHLAPAKRRGPGPYDTVRDPLTAKTGPAGDGTRRTGA